MSGKIRTLHLTNSFYDHSGGIATFYRALIGQANRDRREIALVVPGEGDRLERVGDYGRIYHVEAPKAPLNDSYRILYPYQFLFPGSKIQAILKAERPDVVEICDKYNLNYLGAVLRLRLLTGIDFRPLVLGLSCERMDENFAVYLGSSRLQRWFCSFYMHWLYFPFFDHHIGVSQHTAEELSAAAGAHAVRRGVWIRPMGVDVDGLSPGRACSATRQEILHRTQAPENAVLLLYVGRLAPEKNLPLLLNALNLLQEEERPYRLLIVGDGKEREGLERMAAGIVPGKVAFWGHVSDRERLADIYANCDVFVHPNPREPFGIAPLEAMASGLPLVAPNSGGITSFANDSNATLVPAEAENFAAALRLLVSDEGLRARRASAALETAQSYSWATATSAYLLLYDSLYSAFANGEMQPSLAADLWSTPATAVSGTLVSLFSAMARFGFRAFERLKTKTADTGAP